MILALTAKPRSLQHKLGRRIVRRGSAERSLTSVLGRWFRAFGWVFGFAFWDGKSEKLGTCPSKEDLSHTHTHTLHMFSNYMHTRCRAIHVYVCAYTYIYIYICVCVCAYAYIYIYIYTQMMVYIILQHSVIAHAQFVQ